MVKITIETEDGHVKVLKGSHAFISVLTEEDEGTTNVDAASIGDISGHGLFHELEVHFQTLLDVYTRNGAPKLWVMKEFMNSALQVVFGENTSVKDEESHH